MDWKDVNTTHCGVGACAEVLQDRWSILILRDLLAGVSKFSDLQRHTGASTAILAKRLRALVDSGIVQERPYADKGQRNRSEYLLTAKGMPLSIVFGAMAQFGYDQLTTTEQPIVQFLHAQTGQAVRVGLFTEDGQQVSPFEVKMEIEPSAHSPNFQAPSSRQMKR